VTGRRALALGLAAAVAAGGTACAGPKPSVSFGGKAVPVNVAFGRPGPDDPRAPTASAVLTPVPGGMGVIPVAADQAARYPGPTPPAALRVVTSACPTANPADVNAQPKTEAGRDLGGPPKNGVVAFKATGKYQVGTKSESYDAFIFRQVIDATTASDGTIHYKVATISPGAVSTASYVGTQASNTQGGVEVPGSVALQSIDAVGSGIDTRPSFNAPKPVTLMPLRPTPGQTFSDATFDPLTGTAYSVNGTVVGKDRVDACGQFVDAWKVQISQNVDTPNELVHAETTYWFATQYGGLVVKQAESDTGSTQGVSFSADFVLTATKDPGQ